MPESDGQGGIESTNAATRGDVAGADVVDDMAALLEEIDATCGLFGEPPAAVDHEIHTLSAAVDRLESAVDDRARAEVADPETLPERLPETLPETLPERLPDSTAEGDGVDAGDLLPEAGPHPPVAEDLGAGEEHALPEAPVERSALDPGEPAGGNEPADGAASDDGLDAAEPAAAPDVVPPRRSDSTSESASTLSELDGSLAEDAEDLLNANFDTVSEVLEEVFEEQAAIVQKPAGDVAIAARAASSDEESEAVAPGVDGSPSDEPEPEPEPEPGPGPEAVVQQGAGDVNGGPLIPDRDEPSGLIPDRAPVEAPPPEDPAATDDAPAEAELLPETDLAPDAPMEFEPAPLDTYPVPAGLLASCWSKLEPDLIRALTIANAPLRLLPQRVQPYVDWIALSLVFWVPIVWVVAFFVVGN